MTHRSPPDPREPRDPRMAYRIRLATPQDVDILVGFTLQEARDAEGVSLDPSPVRRGVTLALQDDALARYWVAEAPDGSLVASASVTTEWSNFHGAHYWWIQSLFVDAAHRGRGLVDQLLDHLAGAATAEGALDLRLYAHQANGRALRVYHRCGFTPAPYVLMRRGLGRTLP
jgi:ribosomal protein S18 acetylase RimI-like enzyme